MNEDKITDLCVAVGELKTGMDHVQTTLDKMNGRVYNIDTLVGRHHERIKDLEEKPSAVKAVLWTGTILGIFILIARLL